LQNYLHGNRTKIESEYQVENPDITILDQFPIYEDIGMTSDSFRPIDSEKYGKEPDITNPVCKELILPGPWYFIISAFHCMQIHLSLYETYFHIYICFDIIRLLSKEYFSPIILHLKFRF